MCVGVGQGGAGVGGRRGGGGGERFLIRKQITVFERMHFPGGMKSFSGFLTMYAETRVGVFTFLENTYFSTNEIGRDSSNDTGSSIYAYAHSEDSDQPTHPCSQIRVFSVRMKTHWSFGCSQSVL